MWGWCWLSTLGWSRCSRVRGHWQPPQLARWKFEWRWEWSRGNKRPPFSERQTKKHRGGLSWYQGVGWGGVGDCGVVTYRGTAVTIQEGNTGGLANSGWKKVLETSVGGYRHKNVGSQKEHQSCKARLMEETTGGKHWRAKWKFDEDKKSRKGGRRTKCGAVVEMTS